MGQLVAEQLLALGRLGVVLARSEVEVGTVSEGQGANRGGFGPTWTRTSAKLVLKNDSIFFWIGSGKRLTAAAGLEREIRRQGKGVARMRLHGS